ncbi:MAG: putative RNA uridine N3 methyltransferase [Candidatus Hodarchaeales archaeon]|jgi:predicted SPOUT superfamily RNA methylase MTH1
MNHIIAIPDSAVIDCSDLRTKTEKIFQIARIAAIFQVKDILVYHDPFLNPSRADRERRVLTRILKYIECPQYLRKRFFPLSRDTAAVGVLSPLATPHHPRSKELKTNEIREAAIFLNQNRAVAEVGGINLLELVNPPKKSLRERVLRFTVIIRKEKGKFLAEILPKPPNDKYWGYSVHSSSSALGKLLLNRTEYKIATSRYCQPISSVSINKKKFNNLLIAFGSPYKGIPELVKAEGKKTNEIFDNCINILQSYGTRALRLEEAMMIAFSKLEMIVT